MWALHPRTHTGTLQAVLLGAAGEQFFSKLPARNYEEELAEQVESEAEGEAAASERDMRTKRRRQRDSEAALQQLQGVVGGPAWATD